MIFKWEANWTFPLVALWWILFAQVTFRRLPNKIISGKKSGSGSPLTSGFKELKWVYTQLKKTKRLKRYLTAFFVYSMGVQTVMLVAVYFGEKEITWPSPEAKTTGLIVSILIIQFIAIGGAYTMAWASKKIGNVKTLMLTNVIWVLICISATMLTQPIHFYLEAALVGFVMGGIQSMSRSTYAKFLPKTNDTASFFSFFDVSEKLGIVFGLFTFGLLEELGNMRLSVGSLVIFFFIGLLLLFRVPKEEVSMELDH
jgi:UMF1 family MFS transporter